MKTYENEILELFRLLFHFILTLNVAPHPTFSVIWATRDIRKYARRIKINTRTIITNNNNYLILHVETKHLFRNFLFRLFFGPSLWTERLKIYYF